MAAKYVEYVQMMLEQHAQEFSAFRKVHDAYQLNQEVHQDKFNADGKAILDIVRDFEDRLCNRSEGSGYGKYTSNLAEKFQGEVKKHFPMIEHIGVVVSNGNNKKDEEDLFAIKKIDL